MPPSLLSKVDSASWTPVRKNTTEEKAKEEKASPRVNSSAHVDASALTAIPADRDARRPRFALTAIPAVRDARKPRFVLTKMRGHRELR